MSTPTLQERYQRVLEILALVHQKAAQEDPRGMRKFEKSRKLKRQFELIGQMADTELESFVVMMEDGTPPEFRYLLLRDPKESKGQ